MGKIRGTHSSPGVYTKITDVQYAAKSLGITTLGLVGETKKGPAFEPIAISDWNMFKDYFGGTSTEKFKGSQMPKYELPYIAKSYLSASDQLYVCRVLGLSGYDAGPAWVIYGYNETTKPESKHIVAILRSRGKHKNGSAAINCNNESDSVSSDMEWDCNDIEMSAYTSLSYVLNCGTANKTSNDSTKDNNEVSVSSSNLGQFKLKFNKIKDNEFGAEIAVSLNPTDKEYIYNVLGSTPFDGEAPVFVEELYDLSLNDLAGSEIVNLKIEKIENCIYNPISEPVRGLISIKNKDLSRRNLGQTFLADDNYSAESDDIFCYGQKDDKSNDYNWNEKSNLTVGTIYKVAKNESTNGDAVNVPYTYVPVLVKNETYIQSQLTEPKETDEKISKKCEELTISELGKKYYADKASLGDGFYFYSQKDDKSTNYNWNTKKTEFIENGVYKVVVNNSNDKKPIYVYVPHLEKDKESSDKWAIKVINPTEEQNKKKGILDVVEVLENNALYCKKDDKIEIASNIGDYKEQFRHAITPWVVSELKGDSKKVEVKKLFRFHTISDGNASNEEVKITIANVRPDDGTFDVLIRDFNDSDGNQTVLESYRGLNMVPGNSKYIGLQIGTLNGDYESKSKYVVVEVIENDMTETCVPCGFMGYPVRNVEGFVSPEFKYNTVFDDEIKTNKQTFGLSDISGVDVDALYYKGIDAYNTDYENSYTNGFHLDSRLSMPSEILNGNKQKILIDGTDEIKWTTVSYNNVTSEGLPPVISSESDMEGTIYEDVKVRKFTLYPYGGFDGWDIYRESRTNGDNYRANKYKGTIKHGYGNEFSNITDGDGLGLTGKAITSDYYAYLAGCRQFADPEAYVINLFATPGIDYVNQKLLVNDIFDIIHERQDSLYVVTTPDKPYGASDATDEMYSPDDAVANLEDSSIDSYYGATYYPWIKYFDTNDSKFISLPVTKDVLRNMANIDNKKYPWFAPAGIERGDVECTRARIRTKLEDEDTVYDGLINPVKSFATDGVKIWGNKTMYSQDTPMNRINAVRMVLYLRKLIKEASRVLIFDQNDETLKTEWEKILKSILNDIKADRGITDYRLSVSQTAEQMDAHEMSCRLFVKPTPTLEYLEVDFVVTPQSVDFEE